MLAERPSGDAEWLRPWVEPELVRSKPLELDLLRGAAVPGPPLLAEAPPDCGRLPDSLTALERRCVVWGVVPCFKKKSKLKNQKKGK